MSAQATHEREVAAAKLILDAARDRRKEKYEEFDLAEMDYKCALEDERRAEEF